MHTLVLMQSDMKYFVKGSLIFMSVLLFACGTKFEEEIAVIDRLQASLDSAKIAVYKWDTGKVYKRITQIEYNVAYIANNKDTLSRDDAFLIDEYSNCRKYYMKMSMKFPAIYENIETLPMQLKNLKKDLSKNLIEKEKATEYLLNEEEMAFGLLENIIVIDRRFESLDATYDSSHEKIIHLIQTIDSSKATFKES